MITPPDLSNQAMFITDPLRRPFFAPLLVLALAVIVGSCGGGSRRTDMAMPDPYTMIGPKHFVNDYPAINPDGTINVVIEIPTGTNAKWEVDKRDGSMRWEMLNGQPRIVAYLGYPGNYGMVPRTLLPTEAGGDGDPLDALVLGPSSLRGSVVRARVVAVLRLLDDGAQDDKLIAVMQNTPMGDVRDLAEFQERFPGATEIVDTWFRNYKGRGRIESRGFGDAREARAILAMANESFEASGNAKAGAPRRR